MTSNNVSDGISEFKQAQMRHKRIPGEPNRSDDLDSLLDFSVDVKHDSIYSIKTPPTDNNGNLYNGPIYGIEGFSGFLYAPQALSPSLQLDLAFAAVSGYCEAPHATNIDLIPPKEGKEENNVKDKMWELWKLENVGVGSSEGAVNQSRRQSSRKKYRSFSKLSWSTMGYHYDWTARSYHEGAKSPIPLLLESVATAFAETALSLDESSNSTTFTPSACIVNYYNCKSVMGGHRDDLELALDKPVVSLSLGLPAVFLLGGKTKEDSPVLPILVRPGDVLILGGNCRLCYHGMARVIPADVQLANVSEALVAPQPFQVGNDSVRSSTISDSDQKSLEKYLKSHRININVRQVLPDGMDKLPIV